MVSNRGPARTIGRPAAALWTVIALSASGCAGPGSALSRGETLFSPYKQKVAEASIGKEAWKVPLGGAPIVEDIARVPDGKLLVGLRAFGFTMPIRESLLVEGGSGKVLWKTDRSKFPGVWSLVQALPKRFVFDVQGPKGTALVVLDPATGAVRWSLPPSGPSSFRPVPDGDCIVGVGPAKKGTVVTGYDAATGAVKWTREFPEHEPSPPAFAPEGVILFAGGAEMVNPSTGKTVWRREDILAGEGGAPPLLRPDGLYLVAGGKLLLLDTASGRSVATIPLPSKLKVTNVYPLGNRLFLRGEGEGTADHLTVELDTRNARALWTYRDSKPSVSNLIADEGRLIFATPTSLVALDKDGKPIFKVQVTELGQDYPVHIRKVGDRIVFVGELVVAAYNIRTGRQEWWDGIDPIHQDANLDALRVGINRAETSATSFGGAGPTWGSMNLSTQAQNQADANFREWETGSYQPGTPFSGIGGRDAAFARGQINSSFSKAYAQAEFQFALMDLRDKMNEGANRFFHEERRDYYRFIQRSIFGSYRSAETKGYVLRPSSEGETVGITVINLDNGKRKFTPCGLAHELFGLWILPDEGRGLVIHEALRPDPEAAPDERGYRKYANFLMATPVSWPK